MAANPHIVRREEQGGDTARTLHHPLNASAVRQSHSLGDACGLTRVGVHHVRVAPGVTLTEKHTHLYCDEFIYVLEGEGVVVLGDDSHAVSAGDFIGLPAGGPAHAMRNTGNTDLVYLVGGNRPDYDVCDYPDLGKRLYLSVTPQARQRDVVALDDIQTL
ncbi:MAG: cupin domain-containing protein [Rhodocyclaceae bacterium]